jgi:hypothetical protein
VITTSAGEERHEIAMDETQELLRLEAKATPRAVHIDATYDLFRRLLPGEAPPILRDVTLASSPVTVIAARDEATAKVARQLADRLLDTGIRQDSANPGEPAPLLLIGTTAEVVAKLAEAGLNGVPESLGFRGTARVWTARQPDGQPLLAVAADNLAALEALLGPLPHYGRTSYLIFQGRQAIETGVWPASDSPLSHRFDG